jgi:hypothetical protein
MEFIFGHAVRHLMKAGAMKKKVASNFANAKPAKKSESQFIKSGGGDSQSLGRDMQSLGGRDSQSPGGDRESEFFVPVIKKEKEMKRKLKQRPLDI